MTKQQQRTIERVKLTKTFIDGLKPQDIKQVFFDSDVLGFVVQIYPSGTKSYAVNYKDKYNRLKRYTIGKHGAVTVEQARATAKRLMAEVHANQHDPAAEQTANREQLTIDGLLDLYLNSAKFAEKAESTQAQDRRRLANHIRPLIGNRRLGEITRDTIRKVKADVEQGKTAKDLARGGAGTARMTIRLLRAIYNWAVDEGITDSNPCERIKLGSDGVREAVLESADDYRRLFEALDTLTKQREMTENAADCIRLLALTGARRNEICACRWRNVDLERGIIKLDPKQHKTGHNTGKPKEIPLPSVARAIIAKRERGAPDDYVFIGDKGEGHTWLNSKIWVRIRKEANLPDGITNHSLRHSLGTMMAMQGAESAQIMGALGHSQLSTTQRYIHLATDIKAQIAEKYTAGIAAALTGAESGQVIELGKA